MACPSISQCIAVGVDGYATVFNPTAPDSWTSWLVASGGGSLNAIACPSTSQCTTVDNAGEVATFNPNAPGTPNAVTVDSSSTYLTAVACPSISQCTAVDQYGDEVTFNPNAPDTPASPSPVQIDADNSVLTAVACPSTTQCTAVDEGGSAVTFNPNAPGSPTPAAISGANTLLGVACVSTSECVAVDQVGNAFVGSSAARPSLMITPAGTGLGTVSGTSISCPGECSNVYPSGTQLTLTATAAGGSAFSGWSGGGCSGTGTCTVIVNADTDVTATFTELPPQTLTVTVAGSGSGAVSGGGITCPGSCSRSYPGGTQVTLTATPAMGSGFAGWSGGGCSGTDTTCVVTVSTAQSVTATFAPGHTLTVSFAGSGSGILSSNPSGINCATNPLVGNSCSASFADGSTVTLSWGAMGSSSFTGWSGGGCSGTGTCEVTMSSDQGVTATFNAGGGGSGGGGSGGGGSAVATTVTFGSVGVSGISVSGLASCAGPSGATCTIMISLSVTETLKSGKVIAVNAKAKPKTTKRIIGLGTTAETLPTGKSAKITVKLNAAGQKLLKSHHKLSVNLAATSGTTAIHSQTVTLKQPTKKKRK